eukprot:2483908-Pleurochrysis_carterae.AAC.3
MVWFKLYTLTQPSKVYCYINGECKVRSALLRSLSGSVYSVRTSRVRRRRLVVENELITRYRTSQHKMRSVKQA